MTASACGGLTAITPFAVAVTTPAGESLQPSGPNGHEVGMAYWFELVSSEGEILETLETTEQRWQTGDTVVAHGNRRYRVVSVIPVEWISEFVDEPADVIWRRIRRDLR